MSVFAKRLLERGLVGETLSTIDGRLDWRLWGVWPLVLIPLQTWRFLIIAVILMLIGKSFDVAHYDDLALGMGGGFLLLFLVVALFEVWWPFAAFVRSVRKLSTLLENVEDELRLAKTEVEQLSPKSGVCISGEMVNKSRLEGRIERLKERLSSLASQSLCYDVIVSDDEGSFWDGIFSARIDVADVRSGVREIRIDESYN